MVNTPQLEQSPAGYLVPTDEGQRAFVPYPLPREVQLSSPTVYLLDEASRAVATLAGVGETTPNPQLLLRPFLRREAVLSSRIEGTQALLSDVFQFEASGGERDYRDAREVWNYVRALERGAEMLADLPLCVRLVNEVHECLMANARGEDKRPGQLRDMQVYIAPEGGRIGDARFIPPPASYVPDLLADWERYLNEDIQVPPLIRCALMHYQFEAIHPYMDGNGRLGRLLIMLFLREQRVLPDPLLYLSVYFERKRNEYYDHLLQVSVSGDWEPWLTFFLSGVVEQAQDATDRLRQIRDLQEQYRLHLQALNASGNLLRLGDELFANPYMRVSTATRLLGITPQGARGILDRLVASGIVEHIPGSRPRLYLARELLTLIEAPLAPSAPTRR